MDDELVFGNNLIKMLIETTMCRKISWYRNDNDNFKAKIDNQITVEVRGKNPIYLEVNNINQDGRSEYFSNYDYPILHTLCDLIGKKRYDPYEYTKIAYNLLKNKLS